MRIRLAVAYLILGVAALCVFPCQTGQAQSVVISSSVSYNPATNQVTGSTQTVMDYYTSAFYQASASGALYVQGNSNPISSGTNASIPGVNSAAVVTTQASALPNKTYTLNGSHLIGTLYRDQAWNGVICGNYYPWNDVYQYIYYGYSNYGASATFYAGYPGACLTGPYINFGTTTTSLVTPPPNVTITNPRVSGNLVTTTQNALIGADVPLTAAGSPAGGTYSWSFTGSPTIVSGAANQASLSLRWTQQSTFRATVSYTVGGSTVTKYVDVNNRMPSLSNFTATMYPDQVYRNQFCSNQSGVTYTLGCYSGGAEDGIIWSTTATIPTVTYLSDPAQSGIKFVQAVSVYRKRLLDGNTRCSTARSSQADVASGWQLDTTDPYNHVQHPVRYFSQGNPLTMSDFDAPGNRVEWIDANNVFHSYDAFLASDFFEVYVFYFTGSNPSQPIFQRAIGLQGSGNPYARLAWSWGGQVLFDYSMAPILYRLQTSYTTPGQIGGSGTNSIMPMTTNAAALTFVPCAGPSTSNQIDGSIFFTTQLYLDFLNRQPDASGLNYWRSNITQCAFDINCILQKRVDVTRAFFYSSEFVGTHPALGGQRGTHAYNEAFIMACYDGFLRRAPNAPPDTDWSGFNYWVGVLDGNNPDASDAKYNNVINAFLLCSEYRSRFGPP